MMNSLGALLPKKNYYDGGNVRYIDEEGVRTDYEYYPSGNLKTKTDANKNTITYEWNNGRISKVITPIYSVARNINNDGTV